MPKRPHPPDNPRHPLNGHWSIGSNGLTSDGQSELLKHLGRQLQATYQNVFDEPAPDRLRKLMEKLQKSHDPDDDEL